MKILIINELRNAGGTEVQTKREIKFFKSKGHQMFLLTFDPLVPLCITSNQDGYFNIPVKFSKVKKVYHRLFEDIKYQKMIKKVIDVVCPDYIHINNIFNLPLDVYKAVQGYKTFQTIRDYAAVCPKSTCIISKGNICGGYLNNNCIYCVFEKKSVFLKRILLTKYNQYRINSVNLFVSPSQALASMCTNNGIPTKELNNQFDFNILDENVGIPAKKIYLYYGGISEYKGVTRMIEAFNDFYNKYSDVELWIAGKVNDEYVDTFKSVVDIAYVKYKGILSNNEIMKMYKNIYCVIVPSLWIENYPNTVLEAIANKTMVIGSNRGGIPELIGNKDQLFNVLDTRDIVDKLVYTYNMKKDEYNYITEKRYSFILENNSQEKYYQRLCDVYSSL